MRNVLKAETLERKFPLLSVENGCIVSKDVYKRQVHIYENNIPGTRALIAGDETVRFGLNV